jgi:hypothetical protein
MVLIDWYMKTSSREYLWHFFGGSLQKLSFSDPESLFFKTELTLNMSVLGKIDHSCELLFFKYLTQTSRVKCELYTKVYLCCKFEDSIYDFPHFVQSRLNSI